MAKITQEQFAEYVRKSLINHGEALIEEVQECLAFLQNHENMARSEIAEICHRSDVMNDLWGKEVTLKQLEEDCALQDEIEHFDVWSKFLEHFMDGRS